MSDYDNLGAPLKFRGEKQMTKAFMPFRPEFRDAIVSPDGPRKILTTRTKKYGEVGDKLQSTFGPIRLVMVTQAQLGLVAWQYYVEEGCANPEDFIRIWNEIHPRKRYDPAQLVWLHQFRYLGESR